MWMLRILKGPKEGLVFPISEGINTIGKDSSCSIQINAQGISRTHAHLHVQNAELILIDKSTNGTFINGIKIHKEKIEPGDKIYLHKVVCDIIRNPFSQYKNLPQKIVLQDVQAVPQLSPDNFQQNQPHLQIASEQQSPQTFFEKIQNYLEKIVLPGIYKLAEWMDFKWVIVFFSIGFIFLAITFSTLPMTWILKSSIENESLHHAESIATSLALENRHRLQEGLMTSVSVDFALRRPGVKRALIIDSSSGRIIAPIENRHDFPKSPRIHKNRKLGQKITEKTDSSTILSMIPISYFNAETSSNEVLAYSVVLFDMDALGAKGNESLSLLIQSLFIALLFGSLIFFFLYRVIVFPIENINEQLNHALKDPSQDVSTKYQFPALLQLCSNINSSLERIATCKEQHVQEAVFIDRSCEMKNLTELVGFPCLCIQTETLNIIETNSQFEDQTGLQKDKLLHHSIDSIEDISLQQNLKEVVEKVIQNPSDIYVDQIDFNSNPFQVTAQGVYGEKNIAYILVAFIPVGEEE